MNGLFQASFLSTLNKQNCQFYKKLEEEMIYHLRHKRFSLNK